MTKPAIYIHNGPDKEAIAELRDTLRMVLDANVDQSTMCSAFETLRAFVPSSGMNATLSNNYIVTDAVPESTVRDLRRHLRRDLVVDAPPEQSVPERDDE